VKHSLICCLLLAFMAAAAVSCSDPAKKLPVYGQVPHFDLIDSSGQPFDSRSLNGKVWIADFIYTNCPGPCPRMTSQMHGVERKIEGDGDVRIVSFSVDPAHDSPPVLNDFAHRFGGPTPQWFFLTGAPQTLHNLARNVFMVGDLVGVMDHSTKFIVVDKKGRIRGYYSTFDPQGISALLHDINALRRSRA
jgi:protein SCO1/2